MRRPAPALAALLVALVVVQTTDLVACADRADAAEHAGETHADPCGRGGHPAHDPGHDEGAAADCLCHVVFAPTAVAPTGGAVRAEGPARFYEWTAPPPEVEPSGLDHVPLG